MWSAHDFRPRSSRCGSASASRAAGLVVCEPHASQNLTHAFGCLPEQASAATGWAGGHAQRAAQLPDMTGVISPLVPFLDPEYIYTFLTQPNSASMDAHLLRRGPPAADAADGGGGSDATSEPVARRVRATTARTIV